MDGEGAVMELRGYQPTAAEAEQQKHHAAQEPTGEVGRQQASNQNHRADPTDSNGDGLANADHVGVGRPMTKAASRCRLQTESGTNELLAQRP